MQTVIAFDPQEDKRSIQHYRRESSFWHELSLIDLDKGCSVLELRFYGSGATVYAVTWIHAWEYGPDFVKAGCIASCRGYGKAGGYGYHKPSAAAQEAFKAAGITLAEDIGGLGDSAIEDALRAFAVYLGISRPYIHRAHA